jgi:hypothetical protein
MVHFRAGIADDLDVLGQELIPILLHFVNGGSGFLSFRLSTYQAK